jgi:transposase
MIPREVEAKILRLHAVEGWPVGTISSQLDLHHETVERVVAQADAPRARQARPSMIDPFVPFVKETWGRYPRLTASRLYAMCKGRGYPGAKDHFRHAVAPYRPRPAAEAFLRLKTLQGEQAQVDWAHFGKLSMGRAERPLMAFVAVLSFSRAIFLRFYLGQQTENFLRGHEAAFARWGGLARVCLYDNLKSAVLERKGDAIRFNRSLLDFAAHYRFEPRPVAPGRGNEKPRVERAIRYIRSAFFMARPYRDLKDLNAQADAWCEGEAMERSWPEDRARKVKDAFEEEREKLLPLPENPYPTDERREVKVQKTPYVRFDGNDYSVPHELVRQTLTVHASLETVRIFGGTELVASHGRSFDRGRQIEDEAHVKALVEAKREARKHRGLDRLGHAAPSTRTLLERLAERGKNLGSATYRLLLLLDTYGAESLDAAVREVLDQDVPHVHGVKQVLERERRARGMPPALPVPLGDDPRLRAMSVRPHRLATYDALTARTDGEHPNRRDEDEKEEARHDDRCEAPPDAGA